MTAKRRDDVSMDERLKDPGFTPSAKDAAGLLKRVATDDPNAKVALRALAKIEGPIMRAVAEEYATRTHAKARRAILGLAGDRFSRGEADASRALLLAALTDVDAGTRKLAAKTSVVSGDAKLVSAAAAHAETDADVRAALAESFGMRGDPRARDFDDATASGPRASRARLVAARATLREEASTIREDIALASLGSGSTGAHVVFRVRGGLEQVLIDELSPMVPNAMVFREGRVDAFAIAPLGKLGRARVALDVGLVVEATRHAGEDDASLVARVLAGERSSHIMTTLTRGPVRVRVAWSDGQKRRKETWRIAELLGDSADGIVADSRDAPWEAIAAVDESGVRLELYPRLENTRFAYRVADVPAASHPTIAAALARVGGVRRDDVVWDPFVGSGLELCERARLGPYARLIGTDIDERALDRARENIESAGVLRCGLMLADAKRADVGPISLVLTNPPMGRRVSRGVDLGAMLFDVVAHAAKHLVQGGRIVILSPNPAATARAAKKAGLTSTLATRVDLGGFVAELQRWESLGDESSRRSDDPGTSADSRHPADSTNPADSRNSARNPAERGNEGPRTSRSPRGPTPRRRR